MNPMQYLMKQPRWILAVQGIVAVFLLGLVDYYTGPEFAFSLFYLLPICAITWAVGRTAGVMIAVGSAGIWLAADISSDSHDFSLIVHFWNGTVRLGFFLIVVYLQSAWKRDKDDKEKALKDQISILADEIVERTRTEEVIRVSHQQLRQLTASIEAAREEERIAVARELHDVLGQALTGLRMDLSWLGKKVPQEETVMRTRVETMKADADLMLKATKEISARLRPAVLDHFGLVAALEWQTQDFQRHTDIKCSFRSNVEVIDLEEERTTAVYRIYCEALTNVARHAKATELVACLNQADGKLTLEVTDNGRGITDEEVSDPMSLGLLGIRERALQMGGWIELHGSSREGTTLTLRIPMPGRNQKP